MVQTFTVTLKNMEVRKIEETEIDIDGKIYRSLMIHFDDEEGSRLVFKDKQVDNIDKYHRGDIGELNLTISTENITKTAKNGSPYITEKTTMIIKSFVVKHK